MPARRTIALLTLLLAATGAPAQQRPVCASDGQPRPRALLERFTSADCDGCWTDPATARPAARELAIDWIVPSPRRDEAPLSAAALPEANARLEALRREPPAPADAVRQPLMAAARTLRVAHGIALNGYLGTSIALEPAGRAPWTAWLLLVETLPAGAEGSPVERNLVRGAWQPYWSERRAPTAEEQKKLVESRPMHIPEGAKPERLRVVGWVEDAQGRIRAIAESRCLPVQAPR